MSYQPPCTINAKIIHLISAISEQVGVVQCDFLDASPQLRKVNRIKTITGTLAIEGSTMSEDQVAALLEGKLVSASPRELAEVAGAIAAYEQLQQLDPFKLDDLRRAHQLMMGDLLPHAGRFRNKAVGVYQGREVIHVAPPANRVSGLMADLFQWINQSEQHPLITSTVFHYEFIHPFMDGNGRMGRLWQTLLLAQWNSQPEARIHMLTTFYDSGEVDASRYVYQPLDFDVGGGLPGLAKTVLAIITAVLVVLVALAGLVIWFVVRRARQRRVA